MTCVMRWLQEKCRELSKGLYVTFFNLIHASHNRSRQWLVKILQCLSCSQSPLSMVILLQDGQHGHPATWRLEWSSCYTKVSMIILLHNGQYGHPATHWSTWSSCYMTVSMVILLHEGQHGHPATQRSAWSSCYMKVSMVILLHEG